MRAYTGALLFQQHATLRFRRCAAVSKCRVAQHFPDRHSRCLHAVEKFDPDQNGCVVITLARSVPVGIGKQPDPLVVADGVGRQSRTLRQLANLHANLSFVTTPGKLRVRAYSKSSSIIEIRRREVAATVHLPVLPTNGPDNRRVTLR